VADNHVWIRCCECGDGAKGTNRLLSFSDTWGMWNPSATQAFIEHHLKKCHEKWLYDRDTDHRFFELVDAQIAEREGWWVDFHQPMKEPS